MAVAIGRIIDRRQPDALKKLRIYGQLRLLNDPAIALDQARFLASQYAAGTVRPHYEQQLANLYNATWKVIADKHAADPHATGKAANDMPTLVRRRADLAVIIPAKETAPLYVRDSDDDLAPSLVASIDGLLLDIKGADRARVGAAAVALFGKKVSRLSKMRYDVKIDDVVLDDIETGETALDQCPWLRVMLAVAMEGLRGTDAGQLPSDRGLVLERLSNVALVAAEDVAFEINDQRIMAPGDRPAYVFRRSDRPTLVMTRVGDPLTWNGLQLCLPAICKAIDLSSVANGMRLLAHELAAVGEAIRYVLSRWEGLCRFIDDGRVEIDSNIVERSIRPIALTRKNALFAGSDGGAEHWAVIASLVETCKLSSVDPQAYHAAGWSVSRREVLVISSEDSVSHLGSTDRSR